MELKICICNKLPGNADTAPTIWGRKALKEKYPNVHTQILIGLEVRIITGSECTFCSLCSFDE